MSAAEDILSLLENDEWDRTWNDDDLMVLVEHYDRARHAELVQKRLPQRSEGDEASYGRGIVWVSAIAGAIILSQNLQTLWPVALLVVPAALSVLAHWPRSIK